MILEKQVGPDRMSGSYDTCERKLSETLSAMCGFGDRNMSRDHSEALAVILERSVKMVRFNAERDVVRVAQPCPTL